MKNPDFGAPRLFIEADLAASRRIELSREQAHYLRHVLRLGDGAGILVFNGRDGEWLARLASDGRRLSSIEAVEERRPQTDPGDLHLLFAPLKHARLDYMVQKAVEMGASRLSPVITRRTQVARLNLDRMLANAVEAAEQCGILRLPELRAPELLQSVIAGWDIARTLIFCDEANRAGDPLASLGALSRGPLGVLVGPEGGFAPDERELLSRQPFVVAISLGPRILRADTAAVAALALLNAVLGDWR